MQGTYRKGSDFVVANITCPCSTPQKRGVNRLLVSQFPQAVGGQIYLSLLTMLATCGSCPHNKTSAPNFRCAACPVLVLGGSRGMSADLGSQFCTAQSPKVIAIGQVLLAYERLTNLHAVHSAYTPYGIYSQTANLPVGLPSITSPLTRTPKRNPSYFWYLRTHAMSRPWFPIAPNNSATSSIFNGHPNGMGAFQSAKSRLMNLCPSNGCG